MTNSSTSSSERGLATVDAAALRRASVVYLALFAALVLAALGVAEQLLRQWVVPIGTGRANRIQFSVKYKLN